MIKAYDLIKEYYGDKIANRSKVPYINHIDEGLKILTYLGAEEVVKDAFCLHPFLQADEDFLKNKDKIPSHLIDAAILTMEYRRVANSYLSKDKKESFVGFSCKEVKQMLIADKVQNFKDFLLHHYIIHERSKELTKYFNNWFELLEVKYVEIVHCLFFENERLETNGKK